MWSLANAPGTPKNALILDLAGYEVVWRACTEPDWRHAISVGDVTDYTVPLSKDVVFFGVRAVDRDGHRSPVAFPVPSP